MVATPAEALAKSRAITRGYGNMCLQFVRVCYGIGARYPSAISAWNNATTKHTRSGTDLSGMPLGAPIFFAPNGSPYGHVAVYAGNGMMRTTNSATNLIHTAQVSRWVASGYRLLGWTEDLNGVKIRGLAPVSAGAAPRAGNTLPLLRRGSTGPYVKLWQQVLGVGADGSFGPRTDEATRAWQRAHGLAADGLVGPGTWSAALASDADRHLARGDKGPAVAVWQAIVGVATDGSFGPGTQEATRGFQGHWGLAPDGKVGPATVGTWRTRVGVR